MLLFTRISLAVLCLLALLPGVVQAQVTGDLRGSVIDATNAAVPSAQVTLTNVETGDTRTQRTDGAGRFSFNLLRVGTYEIKVVSDGFRTSITQAEVKTGEVSSVTLTLELGSVSETVTVTDAQAQLDTESAQIQVSVTEKALQELPVARNPNLIATMSPGVIPVSQNNPFLGSGSYNSNGGRGRGNNITVDNIVTTDMSVTGTGGPMAAVTFTQIKEVKVITNNFSAEYGRNSSSQLMYITQSGTNDFHGEAYEFFRNNVLNARPFFDTSGKPNVIRYNLYGYGIGGPIIRNKLHFYTTYEGFKQRGASPPRIAQVPTASMLAQVTDPTSKALLDQYKLPAAAIDQGTTGTVPQSAANRDDNWQWSVRIDYQLLKNNTLTFRFNDAQTQSASAGLTFIGTNLANFGANSQNKPRQISVSDTHVFGASIVNEARFAYSRSFPEFPINSTVPLGPRITFADGSVSSFGVWEGLPQGRGQEPYQFADTVSIVRGAHTVKVGFDAYIYRAPSFFDALQRPLLSFNNWADFAAGRPNTVQQRFGTSVRNNNVNNHFYFLQDDWKVNRDLTLNLGVRVEVAEGVKERDGLISNLNLGCRDSIGAAGSGPFGCLVTGQPSFGTNTNWAPRFGFAWKPMGSNRTVIRGGYGMAYDFIFTNPITNQRFLPPFIVTGSLSGTGSFVGGNSLSNIVAGNADFQKETSAQVGKFSPTAVNFGNISPAIDAGLRNPQIHQWSLGVQRELTNTVVVKASYVGTKGNFLQRTRALNLVFDPRFSPATSLEDETAKLSTYQSIQQLSNGTPSRQSNRMDPRYNQINYLDSSSNSNYHSFQVDADKRFSNGYLFKVGYTWSKSIDDGSDALGVLINDSSLQQNPLNLRQDRAASQFDVRQRLVITHSWELPWGANLSSPVLKRIVHGWGFSGISSFRTGFPVSFDTGPRRGINPSTLTGGGSVVRPNTSGAYNFDPKPAGSAGQPVGLNTDPVARISSYAQSLGLSQPLIGNFGNLGRNVDRLNGQVNFDFIFSKNIPITERVRTQFRAELYNAFNQAYFQDVNRNIANTNFGQYTTTVQDSRTIQLALRILF